ncbi:ATP-binding protein [Streptomyces sp. NPDC101490]|uniref:ATP-binding protein n=1 Tax=Streptomyces sp. NPDC101490 TaxID=3366143 RepID=UPI00382CCAD4
MTTTRSVEQERTRRRALSADGPGAHNCTPEPLMFSFDRSPDSVPGAVSPRNACQPRQARRILRAALRHWKCVDVMDTALLLLTELVTNALQHGDGPTVGVRVELRDGSLMVAVTDGSAAVPVPRRPGPDAENGRGLFLVDALSTSWGVSPDGGTTWFVLSLTEGATT